MSAMSDYLEGQIRAHIFRTASFAKPTVLAVALFTTAPSDAGGGVEVSGGSYARVQRDPLDANWSAPDATGGQTANVAALTFPSPTADWGTVVAVGIFDATSGGNLLFWGPMATPRVVSNGDPAPTFPAGTLIVTFA